MTFREVLRISRPRFWLYEAATFGLVGTVAALQGFSFFSDWRYWVFALYFLIPANILIYGINDIFDYETDKLNPKKGDGAYEALVGPEKSRALWTWIIFTNVPFFFFVPFTTPLIASFVAFIFFASMYSAYPIRAKVRPVLDSLFSAGHYVATGVFGYYLAGGTHFPTIGVIAGMCWAVAMHAYSAVPDIKADFMANLKTIAIIIGAKRTIYLCWFLYILAAFLVRDIIPIASIIGAVTFSYFMWRSTKATTDEALFKLYTYFPLINTLIGAAVSMELFAKNIF
ncbi:MAG: prenyltransferase [Candidatus Pacebacteria bacterium]|nr:prenyltransferase [Candidatus Paceibacterota bacterium]MBP9701127.1 prenyltransferase [Candidatus Paceibacterota bacterium]